MRHALVFVLILLARPAFAQAPAAGDWAALDPQNTVVFETTKGQVVVEMRPEMAPNHVARAKALTRSGFYNGALFYRVLKGFMAQTGDKGEKRFNSTLPNLKAEFSFAPAAVAGRASFGTSPLGELGFVGAAPVVIDPATGRGYGMFCPGTASIAHGDAPDTANSQLFLMRGLGGPTLEAKFSVWGRVVAGQSVVDALNDGEPPPMMDKITRARVMADIPLAARHALMVMDTRGPAFQALVEETRKAKGPNFSLCDVVVPTR